MLKTTSPGKQVRRQLSIACCKASTDSPASPSAEPLPRAVISDGWPAMERGSASPSARQALDGVYKALLTFESSEQRDTALASEILHQLNTMTEMRRARLSAATEGLVSGVLWPILFGGAVVTIAYTFFFGSRNLRAQALMTGMLSIIIFSGLMTAVVIDRPFAGAVKVPPHPLARVLEDFGSMPGKVSPITPGKLP